ncbi:hypothetical protein B566_EDAN014436 [Ephemera danica]|nr:hypothetical protein B566_EDAN014436 [Ephemera danica]
MGVPMGAEASWQSGYPDGKASCVDWKYYGSSSNYRLNNMRDLSCSTLRLALCKGQTTTNGPVGIWDYIG